MANVVLPVMYKREKRYLKEKNIFFFAGIITETVFLCAAFFRLHLAPILCLLVCLPVIAVFGSFLIPLERKIDRAHYELGEIANNNFMVVDAVIDITNSSHQLLRSVKALGVYIKDRYSENMFATLVTTVSLGEETLL